MAAVNRPLIRRYAMGKDKKQKQTLNRFRTGRKGGCEALLYEFRERQSPIEDESDGEPESQEAEFPLGSDSVHIAANTFEEALAYLRWQRPDFQLHSMQCLGLIIMVSGSPLD